MPAHTREVDLPDWLVGRVEQRLEYTEFDSAEEYIAYVLEQLLRYVEAQHESTQSSSRSREMQERLEALGYLQQ